MKKKYLYISFIFAILSIWVGILVYDSWLGYLGTIPFLIISAWVSMYKPLPYAKEKKAE